MPKEISGDSSLLAVCKKLVFLLSFLPSFAPFFPCIVSCSLLLLASPPLSLPTQAELGHVYVLVNNAGIVSGQRFLDIPDRRIELTFGVNVLAHCWTIKAFLPHMLEQNDGHIVCIASAAGYIGSPRMVDYCSSKFAARGLMEALRLELATLGKTGVKTSIVCPAHIKTELFQGFDMPLIPSMSPPYVARQVVEAVQYNRDLVTLPPVFVDAGIIVNALFPPWLADLANFPASNAMSNFDPKKANAIANKIKS